MKRTRPGSRRADLNPGKPTRRPSRVPVLLAFQLSSARARSARPDEKASFKLSAHHGATPPLARFHAMRNDPRSHPTDPWDGSAPRASRSAFTCARPQLNALRRAPKCERIKRPRSGSVGHSTSNFAEHHHRRSGRAASWRHRANRDRREGGAQYCPIDLPPAR